jgi:hypothetical protein
MFQTTVRPVTSRQDSRKIVIVLVGRDREVGEIEAAFHALGQRGALFLVHGEPGIGKTRLATEVVDRARARGLRASWGRCWEAGGAPALWPWREAFEGLAAAFPEPTVATDPNEARFALFREVAAALRSAGPCVIALDDLHAADRSSLLLLESIAGRVRELPLLLIGTYRDLEASLSPETAGALARAGRSGRVVALAPLDETEVSTLVRASLADADDRLVASIYETTHGHPLFVDELIHDPSGLSGRVPLGVREIIRQRLALVSAETRRVLEAASVLGVATSAATLARMEPAGVDDAARSGLVTLRGDRMRFSHALYREALYHDLPRARRQAMHREAARALAATGAPLSEIAHHLLEAGPDAAAEAIDHAIRAAYQAVALFAFEDAAALLERARTAVPPGPQEPTLRCRVIIAAAEVRIGSGDASGRAACVEAAELARTLGDAELLARAGLAYGSVLMMGGVDPVLVKMLEEALAGLAEAPLRALVMARLAAARQPSPPAERARDVQLGLAAIELARRIGDPRTILEVIHSASGVLYNAVDPPIRLAITRQQEELAEQLADVPRLVHARVRLAIDHLEMGNFAAHAQLADTYEQLATRVGPAAAPWRVPLMRSMHALVGGDFARSEELQAAARTLDHGQPRARRACAFHRICALRTAERHAELRAALPELRGLWLQMPFGSHLADARVAAMLARIGAEDEVRALLAQLPDEAYDEEINAFALAEATCLICDATHVRRLQAHRFDRWPMYWFDAEIVEGPGARLAAYLAALAGDWTACEQLAARALRDLEAAGWRSLAARTRFELGDLMLRRDREPARAKELVAGGRAEAAALGLDELVALIDRRHGSVAAPRGAFAIALEGEVYTIASPRGLLRFKASRGMQYLARLVAEPGVEIHVLDLVGSSEGVDRGDAGELLDPAALRAYRARLEALRDAAEDAEARGDVDRAERARDEMEAIAAELSRGTGLGGKARRTDSAVDRARSAVQRRIKDAVDRIAEQDAQLGDWVRARVRTGNHCSFRADS